MWRFSVSLASVSDTAKHKFELWEEEKRAAWLAGVTDTETRRFVGLPAWKRRFEAEENAEDGGGGGDDEPGMLRRTAIQLLTDSIRDNLMGMMLEVASRLLLPAERSVNAVDEELAEFLNAVNGVCLTFRFEEADREQMKYLREVCADRIALSLGRALERHAKRLDLDPDQVDPDQLEALAGELAERVVQEIEGRQEEALASVKGSPLFAMAVSQSGAEAEVEKNIGELQAVLRTYVRSQTARLTGMLRVVIRRVLVLASRHMRAIRDHTALEVAERAGAPRDADGAEEKRLAFEAVRNDVLEEIEEAHRKLDEMVGHYVRRIVFMVSGLKEDEGKEKDRAQIEEAKEGGEGDDAAPAADAAGAAPGEEAKRPAAGEAPAGEAPPLPPPAAPAAEENSGEAGPGADSGEPAPAPGQDDAPDDAPAAAAADDDAPGSSPPPGPAADDESEAGELV